MQEVQSINSLSGELTALILPWIAVLVSAIIAFMLKDFITNFAKGLAFQMNSAFNEGDKVIIDGSEAIIVKVGIKQTVFGVFSDKGYTWRYVPNERIPFLKIEKVVDPDLHKDSEEEKGRRIQKMIDSTQDKKIDSNHHHIEKNAEEIEKLKNKDGKN
jgi:hypothetical protein